MFTTKHKIFSQPVHLRLSIELISYLHVTGSPTVSTSDILVNKKQKSN